MKNILVIDDDHERLGWFIDTLEPGYEVRTADDSDTALDQLIDTSFDVVFFDYDLGLGSFMKGSTLLGFILHNSHKYHTPKNVWTHSMDPLGVKKISAKCESADIPYVVTRYSDLVVDAEGFLESLENFLTVD